MIKKMAWNMFKNTGDINTFIELMQLEETEKYMKAVKDGDIQNKGNNNIGKQDGRL